MLNSSFFVRNWGSDVEGALLKRCPPATARWGERLRCCRCFEGGEMGVFSTLHEFLSPKWSPPVLSLDRGGRCIVQRCGMTFTQCFCPIRGGEGGGLRFKQELGECFASYIHSREWPTVCLARPTLHLSL